MWRRPCRRFLDQTARLTLLGCVIGLAAGFALTRIAEGILFVKVGSLVPRRTLQCSRNMPNAPFEAPEPNARQAGPRAKEETAGLANRVRSDMTRKRLERTRTRSSLTRSLQRIAAGLLASQRVYEIEWSDRLLPGRQFSRIRVDGLWVAGSYARGTVECGDLDVIANVSEQGGLPGGAVVSRVLVGGAPDVRLYCGRRWRGRKEDTRCDGVRHSISRTARQVRRLA